MWSSYIKNSEIKIFYRINSINFKPLDLFFKYVTHFGHPTPWITLELISIFLGYYYLSSIIAIGLAIDSIISVSLQYIIRRKRPFQIINKDKIIVRRYETTPSFPSAHTERSFFICTILFLMWDKNLYLLFLFAAAVGISRIYLGAHFPLDIIFGAIFGIFSAFIFNILLHPFLLNFAIWIWTLMLRANLSDKFLFLCISICGILLGTIMYEKNKDKKRSEYLREKISTSIKNIDL